MNDLISKAPVFPLKKLALIGLGLIGSSLARVAREKALAQVIVGTDHSSLVRERAEALGFLDQWASTAAEAVEGADLVILCTPVGANKALAQEIAFHLAPDAIVSDVGSVKQAVIAAIQPYLPPSVHFIPAHPIAGTEFSGPDAGFASLFVHRWCIVTPLENCNSQALETLLSFWRGTGAFVETMPANHHDLVLAMTSHLPHLIAYNIVQTASDLEEVTESEVIKFSAGGFRDFTRIAASDPTMWRDIFLNNGPAVLEILGRFQENLAALQRMVRWGNGQGLYDSFSKTRGIRQRIIGEGQETSAPDFGRPHLE